MRRLAVILLLQMCGTVVYAQVRDTLGPVSAQPPTQNMEQQLENITAANEDAEIQDDSYLQQMAQFTRNPLNLNTADEASLKELLILSPLQIQNLVSYRAVLGKLIDIYELQAIPGWDIRTIQRLLPYVTVNSGVNIITDFSQRFNKGQHSVLVRGSRVLEKSKGYLVDPAEGSAYLGSPLRLMFRYKYVFKNLLQYGLVGEKDAGEEFFKGSQKKGFDFYSLHFFLRNLGIVKSLALGDFTVNMGQGLTSWQSLAFKKGPDIISIKRQSTVLRPYNSAAEIEFHRGVGVTIGKNNWEVTVFGSYRKLDANFNADDTLNTEDDFVSSLQTSGYHRTKSEVDDKGVQRQIAFGGNASIQIKRMHLGVNAVQYQFKYPINKDAQPYNKYALNGKSLGNYSFDYSYTYRNLHMFGEVAMSNDQGVAFVNGLLISVSNQVDMSFLYRNISREYQSLYTNAFTESSTPNNEKGLFSGITVRPTSQWQIDAYADIFKSPWLKYRVDAPSNGSDYFVQVTYKPNKQLEMYSRYKRELKAINYNPDEEVLNPVVPQPKQNWRMQFGYKINPSFTVRARTEMVWFDKKGTAAEEGFMLYTDVFYRQIKGRFAGNLRLQYFETGGYDSRLYTYESDVLYYFSIPVLYDKGYRYYVNASYDFSKKLSVWAKWIQTIYSGKDSIGSGLDEIQGNVKSELRLQVLYRF